MSWTYEFDSRALKELKKIGPAPARRIIRYLDERIDGCDDPRPFGKPLSGNLSGLWRYRVGDYRLICSLEDTKLIVLVLRVGHRRGVYE